MTLLSSKDLLWFTMSNFARLPTWQHLLHPLFQSPGCTRPFPLCPMHTTIHLPSNTMCFSILLSFVAAVPNHLEALYYLLFWLWLCSYNCLFAALDENKLSFSLTSVTRWTRCVSFCKILVLTYGCANGGEWRVDSHRLMPTPCREP